MTIFIYSFIFNVESLQGKYGLRILAQSTELPTVVFPLFSIKRSYFNLAKRWDQCLGSSMDRLSMSGSTYDHQTNIFVFQLFIITINGQYVIYTKNKKNYPESPKGRLCNGVGYISLQLVKVIYTYICVGSFNTLDLELQTPRWDLFRESRR